MTVTKQRGGTQIGWVSSSWPLAAIEVSPNQLTISSMGKYIFSPAEVTTVEVVGSIPFFFQGIRIHHNKAEYPEKIVFLTLYGRQAILDAIRGAGFQIGQPSSVVKRGFPFRTPASISVVVMWNLLFLLDGNSFENPRHVAGPYVLLALVTVFLLAMFLPKSALLQKLFMKGDRNVGEVSSLLRLLQLVIGLITLMAGLSFLIP
jgi:hypothetical protein